MMVGLSPRSGQRSAFAPRRREPLHDDKPNRAGYGKCGHADAGLVPWRNGRGTQTLAKRGEDERQSERSHATAIISPHEMASGSSASSKIASDVETI